MLMFIQKISSAKSQLAKYYDKETDYENTLREKDALIENLSKQLAELENASNTNEKYLFLFTFIIFKLVLFI
jgi:hypothetical protein